MHSEDIKNLVIALVLITFLSLAYLFYLSVTAKKQMEQSLTNTDTAATTTTTQPSRDTLHTTYAQQPEHPDSIILLTSKKWIAHIGLPYGNLIRIDILDFTDWKGDTIMLLNPSKMDLTIPVNNDLINTSSLRFKLFNHTDSTVTLQANTEKYTVQYTYKIDPQHPYLISWIISLKSNSNNQDLKIGDGELKMDYTFRRLERHPQLEERYTTLYYRLKEDKEVNSLSTTKGDEETISVTVDWIAFKQQFFTVALINTSGYPFATLWIEPLSPDTFFIKRAGLNAGIQWKYNGNGTYTAELKIFAGPNKYSLLKSLNIELEEILPLGWAIFRWITAGIIIPVFTFLEKYVNNYGLIILVLAILIKIILLPLTWKSYIAMAKLNALRPLLEELKNKYGDDPQKLAIEQLNLMRRAGVSPMGGCLPILLQLPILIAMYRFFPASIELRGQSFLWIQDLSTYDAIIQLPFTIPLYGSHVSLLALLMGISSLLYSLYMQPGTTTTQYKWLTYFMPIFLIVIFNSFPAALNLYYFYYNVLSILQNLLMRKLVNVKELEEKIKKKARETTPARLSWFEARLKKWQELQKQQKLQKKLKKSKTRWK